MGLHLTFNCDGTRNDMSCRGTLHTRDHDISAAYKEATKQGWTRRYLNGKGMWLCPSGNHNEVKA